MPAEVEQVCPLLHRVPLFTVVSCKFWCVAWCLSLQTCQALTQEQQKLWAEVVRSWRQPSFNAWFLLLAEPPALPGARLKCLRANHPRLSPTRLILGPSLIALQALSLLDGVGYSAYSVPVSLTMLWMEQPLTQPHIARLQVLRAGPQPHVAGQQPLI